MTSPSDAGTSKAVASARLDVELVRRGLARSRRQASELVAAGRVRIAGAPARRPSVPLRADEPVEVSGAPGYVSRAGDKLAGALDRLGESAPAIRGRECLDVGASTGGFTQVLLERGARRVAAVDVGHGQLAPILREDPRVVVREGCNARLLTPDQLPARPELVVADVSFISLRLLVDPLARCVAPGADLLLLVKPQFEVGRERLGRGGVVRDDALREDAVLTVARDAADRGFAVRRVVRSPLPGPSGNVELFLLLAAPGAAPGRGPSGPDESLLGDALVAAVAAAVRGDDGAPHPGTAPGARIREAR